MSAKFNQVRDLIGYGMANGLSPEEITQDLYDYGHLMPELPKSATDGFWLPNSRTAISASRGGIDILIKLVDNPFICTAELARSFAFSLLAAAEYSYQEKEQA